MVEPNPHASCGSNAWKPVRCDRCGRRYVCTPADDYYCTPEGDHCCESCLLGGLPLQVVHVDDLLAPAVSETATQLQDKD